MKRREFYIGPGAASLLLVVVVVSMSVLGLLAIISARNDARLAQRSREFVTAEYESAARAERTAAELDALLADCAKDAQSEEAYLARLAEDLPLGVALDGRALRWTEDSSVGRALMCAVEIEPLGAWPRFAWIDHSFVMQGGEALFD